MANWIICPFIDCWEYTEPAIRDFLAQISVEPRVLAIDNGSSEDTVRLIDKMAAEVGENKLLVWHHNPPLPTLNATWNAGLDFVWAAGGEEALVVNNDVRLNLHTYTLLLGVLQERKALFVSAVGVRPELPDPYDYDLNPTGGPDFSCYLISKECHQKYRFDEQFTYMGDNDTHRTIILGGDGDRIFGVNVPYLHYASRTINRSPKALAAHHEIFRVHQERYIAKWGGLPPGGEVFTAPYNAPTPK